MYAYSVDQITTLPTILLLYMGKTSRMLGRNLWYACKLHNNNTLLGTIPTVPSQNVLQTKREM